MITMKNHLRMLYKHILISILLVIIYMSLSFIILNDLNRINLILPSILFIFMIFLIWNAYPSNRVASSVFITFITVFLYSSFFYNSSFMSSFDQLLFKQQQQHANCNNSNNKEQHYNIIFVESNFDSKWFQPRQLCAIESAAAHNPKATVYVFSINAQFSKEQTTTFENEYKNVKYVFLKPEEIFRDTPLWPWWWSKQVMTSPFKTAHLSDALRLALLWKYGGIYSDLDTITVKSFQSLMPFSGAGFLNGIEPSLGNGFLQFKLRHPFLKLIMEKFAQDYNPHIWGFNGPILLRQQMSKYCQVENIYKSLLLKVNIIDSSSNSSSVNNLVDNSSIEKDNKSLDYITLTNKVSSEFIVSTSSSKCDLVVFPQNFFYPYNNHQLDYLFDKEAQLNVSVFMDTYSVHFYGKVSSNYRIKIRKNSVYEYFASNNCELIYKNFKLGLVKF